MLDLYRWAQLGHVISLCTPQNPTRDLGAWGSWRRFGVVGGDIGENLVILVEFGVVWGFWVLLLGPVNWAQLGHTISTPKLVQGDRMVKNVLGLRRS